MIAFILYAVLGVVACFVLFALLVAIVEWANQVRWKGVLTAVSYSALAVIAAAAFLYALPFFFEGMAWIGRLFGAGLS